MHIPREILSIIIRDYILGAKTSRLRTRESRTIRLTSKMFCAIYDNTTLSLEVSPQWRLVSKMIFYKDQQKTLVVTPTINLPYVECQLLRLLEYDLQHIIDGIVAIDLEYMYILDYTGRTSNPVCNLYRRQLQQILTHYAHRIASLVFVSTQRVWSYSVTFELQGGNSLQCTMYSELFYPEKTFKRVHIEADLYRRRIISADPRSGSWKILPAVKFITEKIHPGYKRRVFHMLRANQQQSIVSNKLIA